HLVRHANACWRDPIWGEELGEHDMIVFVPSHSDGCGRTASIATDGNRGPEGVDIKTHFLNLGVPTLGTLDCELNRLRWRDEFACPVQDSIRRSVHHLRYALNCHGPGAKARHLRNCAIVFQQRHVGDVLVIRSECADGKWLRWLV